MNAIILENGDLRLELESKEERQQLYRDLVDGNVLPFQPGLHLKAPIDVERDWFSRLPLKIKQLEPEEIGALTASPILGKFRMERWGTFKNITHVWWYPNYAIRGPLDDLLRDGFCIFTDGNK